MKKFLVFLAIVLLIGTSYFTYEKWVKHSDVSLWSFVPSNSVLVYETNSPLTTFQEVSETAIWKNLSYIPAFNGVTESLDILDTLAGKGNFTSFFQNTPTLIALDITSSRSIDFLYIVEIQNLSQQSFVSKAQAYFTEKGLTKRTREYEGFTITELTGKTPSETFTYIFFKNYFIGSFSAFLVEDAIRTIGDTEILNFRERNSELTTLTKLTRDQGNIYLNMERAGDLINVASNQGNDLDLGKSGFLDLKITDDIINLSGFTFLEDNNEYLNLFAGLNGATFDMAEIIPNNTSWTFYFSTTDPVALGNNLNAHLAKNNPEVVKVQERLLKEYEFDVKHTFTLVDEEIGLMTLESTVTGNQNELLIIETKDMGEALRFFNSVAEREMQSTGDTLYKELFGDYEIRKLPAKEFPYALLGDVAKGFTDCFYLQYRNYLVFSNSLQQLKNLTFSIQDEATWTKSIHINRFLEKTNQESNLNLYVNTPRSWNQLLKMLKPVWQEEFKTNEFSLKNLEFMAFQFSAVDDKFYTNINLYQPDLPKRNIPDRITELNSITVADYITSKPYLVINHNDRSREVFIQDTSNTVYLIDNKFNVLWDKTISGQLKSEVSQIDYYNNGKLQYAFITEDEVHILDRTGSYIPDFPKQLDNGKNIKSFRIIDYDNSKNYRFSFTDYNGNAYLTDKNVKLLEGWNPRSFKEPLANAPSHRRVNGKDVLIAQEVSGKIWLLSRRGENYPGFPKDLKLDITNSIFIKNANSFEEATITALTDGGELIEIDFNGKLVQRQQIYKPDTETTFELLKDVTGDSYVIMRKTGNKYELLNAEGDVLFQKDYFSKSTLLTQYYQLGGGVEFIVMIDTGGTFLYMYDKNGNLISGRPLTANCPISIMQYENEFQIYKVVDRNLELISIGY